MGTRRVLTSSRIKRALEEIPRDWVCRNPLCQNIGTEEGLVRFRPVGKGDQREFCADACRASYNRKRQAYLNQWLDAQWTHGTKGQPTDRLKELIRLLEWKLSQYGGISAKDRAALPQPPLWTGWAQLEWIRHREGGEPLEGLHSLRIHLHDHATFFAGRRVVPDPFAPELRDTTWGEQWQGKTTAELRRFYDDYTRALRTRIAFIQAAEDAKERPAGRAGVVAQLGRLR